MWTDGIYSRRLTTRWTYGGQRVDKKGLPELDAETEVGEVPDFRQRGGAAVWQRTVL